MDVVTFGTTNTLLNAFRKYWCSFLCSANWFRRH